MFRSRLSTTRREIFAVASAAVAFHSGRAFGQQQLGPPPHKKGPIVFLNYDQVELDAAYDQSAYESNFAQVQARLASNSESARQRIGQPKRIAYGSGEIEQLDVFPTKQSKAPIFVFIHGGAWTRGHASDYSFLAELFLNAGAICVIPDFSWVQDAPKRLTTMADQVRRSLAWVYRNAAALGGDPGRLYVGGHSSGGHLAGVALTTDWQKDFGLPPDFIKGGLCVSGIYDLKPVRLSSRNDYVKMDDQMENELSPQRHLDRLYAPLVLGYGTLDTPEFQRQTRDFAAAVEGAGKLLRLIVAQNYAHLETVESLGNPYGPMGRAILQQMNLAKT
jgi:arylformamidase